MENKKGELSHDAKVILWWSVTANELRDKGLVVGNFHKVTDAGMAVFREMEAAGFDTTDEEMAWALRAIGAELAPGLNSERTH